MFGLGDLEVRPNALTRLPATYALNRRSREATPASFVRWIADGVWASFVAYYTCAAILEDCAQTDGTSENIWYLGTTVCSSVILTVTLRLCLEFSFVTWIHVLIVAVSLAAWIIVALFFGTGWLKPALIGSSFISFKSLQSWMAVVITAAISLIPSVALHSLRVRFKPTVDQSIRERELLIRPHKVKTLSDMHTHNQNLLARADMQASLKASLLAHDHTTSTNSRTDGGNENYSIRMSEFGTSERETDISSIATADDFDELDEYPAKEREISERLMLGVFSGLRYVSADNTADAENAGNANILSAALATGTGNAAFMHAASSTSASSTASPSFSDVSGTVSSSSSSALSDKERLFLMIDTPPEGVFRGFDFSYTEGLTEQHTQHNNL